MQITFADKSNQHIDNFVALCDTTSPGTAVRLLVTPSFDQLSSGYTVKDELQDLPNDEDDISGSPITAYRFRPPTKIIPDLIIAVDSGVLHLGDTVGGGVAFAIRGSAVCYGGSSITVMRYNTGALLITPENKLQLFRHVGERLGQPDLYVEENYGKLKEKLSAIDNANRIQDRCRSFIERMIQEEALGILAANGGGLLLVDGALTASFDSPVRYLSDMLRYAREKRVDICAISKRSGLAIGGRPVGALFDEYPHFVGYAPLLPS